MAFEKQYTAKQTAQAVLEKVGELLKKSALVNDLNKAELAKKWTPELGRKQHESLQAKRGESYGHESKGVNSPSYSSGKDLGQSMAGDQLRYSPKHKMKEGVAAAKDIHTGTLKELKAMPKPNLPKSEEMDKGESLEKAKVDTHLGLSPEDKKVARGFRKLNGSPAKGSGKLPMPNPMTQQMGKTEGSDGHYSMNADPGEPKAGKASKPGKCPECGHPSPSTGQGDTLRPTKAQDKWALDKSETENSKKMGYKLSNAGKEEVAPEKSDNAFKVEKEDKKSSNDPRLSGQTNPHSNPKEKAEGNNELAGTTPTQVGQDGKNVPGGDEIKGHLKLAKFIGRMEHKRTLHSKPLSGSTTQSSSEAQHKQSISNKNE